MGGKGSHEIFMELLLIQVIFLYSTFCGFVFCFILQTLNFSYTLRLIHFEYIH